jgi:hypothetical protein
MDNYFPIAELQRQYYSLSNSNIETEKVATT